MLEMIDITYTSLRYDPESGLETSCDEKNIVFIFFAVERKQQIIRLDYSLFLSQKNVLNIHV